MTDCTTVKCREIDVRSDAYSAEQVLLN